MVRRTRLNITLYYIACYVMRCIVVGMASWIESLRPCGCFRYHQVKHPKFLHFRTRCISVFMDLRKKTAIISLQNIKP
jgi:hypothetical protein